MASKVGMISGAAVLLGSNPVISLEEGSKAAVAGDAVYDTTYRALLTQTRWRFASGQIALSQLAASPLNTYTYAYQLPSDPPYLIIYGTTPQMEYEIYEDKLYANNSTVEIDYGFDPGEGNLPLYFVELMEHSLAAKIAMAVTGSRTKREEMLAAIQGNPSAGLPGLRAIAMAADAQQRPSDSFTRNPFVDVRTATRG